MKTKNQRLAGPDLLVPNPELSPGTLPDFVKVPRVPGLPTELTGHALRDVLQARADSSVSLRRR